MPADPNQAAALTVKLVSDDAGLAEGRSAVSRYLAEIGSKGGKKGGKARASALSARKRKEIAQRAAAARWARSKREV